MEQQLVIVVQMFLDNACGLGNGVVECGEEAIPGDHASSMPSASGRDAPSDRFRMEQEAALGSRRGRAGPGGRFGRPDAPAGGGVTHIPVQADLRQVREALSAHIGGSCCPR